MCIWMSVKMMACTAWKLWRISTPLLSLLYIEHILFSFPMVPLPITFLFSKICSHQYFFPSSFLYMLHEVLQGGDFHHSLHADVPKPYPKYKISFWDPDWHFNHSNVQSKNWYRAASASLILWSTSETENVSQWSSESLPFFTSKVYLVLYSSFHWLITEPPSCWNQKAKYCPQSLSWYLTPNFQVGELFLELTYTLLWYFYGYHCCITTLKVRGIKQSFYYARLFCGSGIWTEDDEDGISLSDATCELSCGWLHGWKLTSESIFTHTVVTIFGKHNLQKILCYYEFFFIYLPLLLDYICYRNVLLF